MISINDFEVTSFEKKCEMITSQTSYIAMRCEYEKKIYLYHSGRFFIEVIYSSLLKRVLHIKAFNDQRNLLPYADGVSLNDLV